VRWTNRAAITGLFGSAAQTARQAASRSAGRPRPEIADLPWKAPESLSRGHNPACLTRARAVANRAGSPVSARIAAAPTGVSLGMLVIKPVSPSSSRTAVMRASTSASRARVSFQSPSARCARSRSS
jgi:hypothetical protein